MILLVLVAVLWIVVLTPSALRRRAERQGVGSIDHFHHQLQLLEHAGPKLVAPAYRLHTAVPGGAGAETFASGSVDTGVSRPKLVLLRQTDDEGSADIDDTDGAHYERVGVLDPPEPQTSPALAQAELASYRRQQARQRCTMYLRLLTAAAISSGLIGMFPSLHLLWFLTGLTGIAALALVGLIAYAKEVEVQRRLRSSYRVERYFEEEISSGAAEAGFPGAWDEDEQSLPQQVAAAH